MPVTEKGQKILSAMQEQYGKERGKEVFYASANKGTIEGVHDQGWAPSAAIGDAKDYPVPKRRPDLLGTPATSQGIKPADVKSRDQDVPLPPTSGMSSTAPLTTTAAATSSSPMMDSTKDEKVSEKDLKTATPPMNNLSRTGNPGANNGDRIPYRGVQVGDSLHNQNVRNRAFWARSRTGRR